MRHPAVKILTEDEGKTHKLVLIGNFSCENANHLFKDFVQFQSQIIENNNILTFSPP